MKWPKTSFLQRFEVRTGLGRSLQWRFPCSNASPGAESFDLSLMQSTVTQPEADQAVIEREAVGLDSAGGQIGDTAILEIQSCLGRVFILAHHADSKRFAMLRTDS